MPVGGRSGPSKTPVCLHVLPSCASTTALTIVEWRMEKCFHQEKMSFSVCSQHLALQTASCTMDAQPEYPSATGVCTYLKFFFESILFSLYCILNCITLAYLSFLVLCFYDRDIYSQTCKSLHPHRGVTAALLHRDHICQQAL